jgi:hypothetical protein
MKTKNKIQTENQTNSNNIQAQNVKMGCENVKIDNWGGGGQ